MWSTAAYFQPLKKTGLINKSTIVNKLCKHIVFTNMFSHKDGMFLIGAISYIKIERGP